MNLKRAIIGLAVLAALGLGTLLGSWMSVKPTAAPDSNTSMTAAETAYANKDYATVFEHLQPLAKAGDALAQHRLGLMYADGLGVDADTDLAIEWLVKAVAGNVGAARTLLAKQYLIKANSSTDRTQEISWLKRALALDNVTAQATLGSYHLLGVGVERNLARALELLSAAANSGDPRAMTNLGYMYASGTGVNRDYVQAHKWYLAAAELGMVRAQTALASLYESGLGTEKNLADAGGWYVSAAAAGDANAAARLGALVSRGMVKAPDEATAVRVVAAAAVRGDATAEKWLAEQTLQNNVLAQTALAQLLINREDQPESVERGLKMLQIAAKKGIQAARLALAEQYASGKNIPQDYVKAHSWANLAATSGDPEALSLRDDLAQLMTPLQLAAAQRLAKAHSTPLEL